jgi:hypothetical protein
MKILLVAYLIFTLGTFVLQMVTSDFFLVCQYNAGACSAMVIEQTWHAITWPQYLLFA